MTELGAGLINPAAGNYPVTSDPREVAASIAAGERSYDEFPYYNERYGERGRRFGHSDSAWLTLVVAESQGQVNAEVMWLGSVLSSRGMPQILMERHLQFLYEELASAVPEKREMYGRLLTAAEVLRGLRTAQMSQATADRLAAEFDARVGEEWSTRFRHMGHLIVSAVADERLGIVQAVPVLEAFVLDANRFPAHWIEAVRDLISRARGGPDGSGG